MYDIGIIGAGVIGTAVAESLSRVNKSVVVIEKDMDVACGTTKANSAIVHAGYDAPHHSLKGQLNAKGNAMYAKECQRLHVPFERIGSLVCAFHEDDRQTLEALLENGQQLSIPGLCIIEKEEVIRREPHINKDVVCALYAPTAGIVEPWELAVAYAEVASKNGVKFLMNHQVVDIEKETDHFNLVFSGQPAIQCRLLINCAGVYGDEIFKMVDPTTDFSIHPRRGQYFLLDKTAEGLVNHVVFPCPTKLGKGTLVVPTIDGNVLVGPDSENLGHDQKENLDTTRDRLDLIKGLANQLIENIPFNEVITTFSGLRAEPSTDDFLIGPSDVKGFYNVIGMKSPALSSAPAIAEHVYQMVVQAFGDVKEKDFFHTSREKRLKFHLLSDEEKAAKVDENPLYGNIICRCEMISEAEIVDAIHRPVGGRTLNAIKRRVRPGAGRCQGGFCGPRVLEIIARELELEPTEVCQENLGSEILVGYTKSEEALHETL